MGTEPTPTDEALRREAMAHKCVTLLERGAVALKHQHKAAIVRLDSERPMRGDEACAKALMEHAEHLDEIAGPIQKAAAVFDNGLLSAADWRHPDSEALVKVIAESMPFVRQALTLAVTYRKKHGPTLPGAERVEDLLEDIERTLEDLTPVVATNN